jgi:hypothetical protein
MRVRGHISPGRMRHRYERRHARLQQQDPVTAVWIMIAIMVAALISLAAYEMIAQP